MALFAAASAPQNVVEGPLVPTTQILFGSDNPFVPLAETAEGVTQLGFSAADLERIGRETALALLPRLKTS